MAILLYSLPLLLDIILNGWGRVSSYFAADIYYYLVVAKNFAKYGSFTFDQEFMTNGFHPLWQLMLGLLHYVLLALELSKPNILITVFIINIMLISGAIWLLGQTFIVANKKISFFFILLPIGTYGLFISRVTPAYGTIWSFTNGMESALLIFLYALLAYTSVNNTIPFQNNKQAAIIGVLLALIFLARLDHFFIVLSWIFFYFLMALIQGDKTQFKILAVLIMPPLLILGLYLLTNLHFIGTPMPISGIEKSTFPHLDVITKYKDFSNLLLKGVSNSSDTSRLWRYWQIILPATIALFASIWGVIYLYSFKKLSPLGFVISATGLSVFLLGLYNLMFVGIWAQGHWYFPISILFISLLTLYIIDSLLFRNGIPFNNITMILLSGCLVFLFFRLIYWNPTYNQRYTRFLINSPNILQYYGDEQPKLVEFDDAIISFSTDYPALGGLGFTLDLESMQAKQEERLLQLAYQRGFTRLASFNYFRANELDENSDSDFIAEKLNETYFLTPTETKPFLFSVEYTSDDHDFAIIRMELIEDAD